MKGKALSLLAAASLAGGALFASNPARAEYVQGQTPFFAGVPVQQLAQRADDGSLFGRPVAVWGTSLQVDSLSIAGAGRVSLMLGDLNFPDPLQSLSLLVTDLNGIWMRLNGAGPLSVEVNGPAQLFVAVFAESAGKRDPGMYFVRTDFTPVPLPAAAWLLLSGLGGLVALRRRTASA